MAPQVAFIQIRERFAMMKSCIAGLAGALVATALAAPVTTYAGCDVKSGTTAAALVELYTSEGCSSCPPADRQLSGLRDALGPATQVVALALHVDYWDYIGWKDSFAQSAFAERQRQLVRANHHTVVYTPHFFVSGTELGVPNRGLQEAIGKVTAQPAAADLRLRAALTPAGTLKLDADATARAGNDPVALYLAVAESGLVSKVARGENGGATLAHDHVVREWIGPIALAGGGAQARREVALPATWNRAQLEVVAFVENQRTGKVLQAVSAQQCARS
jgi:hypothetical protein